MVRVNRVRRIIRKVDPWTVLKVSFVFNFIISLTIVLGFSILWVLLVNAGVPQGLEEIARIKTQSKIERFFRRTLYYAAFKAIIESILGV